MSVGDLALFANVLTNPAVRPDGWRCHLAGLDNMP
jgi:hypothetical protein